MPYSSAAARTLVFPNMQARSALGGAPSILRVFFVVSTAAGGGSSAASSSALDQATNATTHSLVSVDPLATCINGAPAWVSVGGPAPKQGATWVLQLGPAYGGAGAPCLDRLGCQMAAKKPIAPPPPFELLATSGPQSPNCTINPDFCTATQAQLVMCDGAMLLGAKDADLNGTKAHFRGVSN